MAVKGIRMEGSAEIATNDLVCVCGFCNDQCRENGTIEFNFREQKVFFYCNACKKMNEIFFGTKPVQPLPRTKMR